MDSIYWVVSRDCNQRCPHCYNNSEPGAPGLTLEQVSHCVSNLPDPGNVPVDRIIISGGEPLVWPKVLFHTLTALHERYSDGSQLMVQSNGDLLDAATLDRLLEHHVSRIDVSGMDHYHPKSTLRRRDYLTDLFKTRGMVEATTIGSTAEAGEAGRAAYAFWGATEDQWIGPLWPRGRARKNRMSKAGPHNNFCGIWSGAKNFLNYRGEGCEVNVQLADVYPCCPMTCRPIGNLLAEPLVTALDRCAQHPVYRALNEGRAEAMGEFLGISQEEGLRRSRELGNHCLWCDEFFTRHAPDLLGRGAMTQRGSVDLPEVVGARLK